MPGSQPIQSVQRAVDIVAVLAHADGETVALKDIAAAVGIGSTTAHNLLRTLVVSGMAENVEGAYRLGHRVVEFAAGRLEQGLTRSAREEVLALEKALQPITMLFSRSIGPHVVCCLRMSPDQPGVMQVPVGRLLHPYHTVSGLAVQAYADNETLHAIRARHSFWDEGAAAWGTMERLTDYIEKVRERGYGTAPFGREDAVRAAVPVFSRGHSFAGVLGAHVALAPKQKSAALEKRVVRALLDAADRISKGENEQ